jgi:mono/diheme cytochrome c family protein
VKKAMVSVVCVLLMVAAVSLAQVQTTRSVRDGVFTEEQRERGSDEFMNNCSMCHGADMNGGEEAPALFGGNFMSDWNGLTVGDLAERIRTSMPPSNPELIDAQQRADIIALILNANGFPAGPKELDSRIEYMRQIKIEPK